MSHTSTPLLFQVTAGKRPWSLFAALLLIVLLSAICIYLAVRIYKLDQQTTLLEEQKEELIFLTERQQAAMKPQQAATVDKELSNIHKKLNKKWLPLLAALDKTTTQGVSLLSVSPDAEHDSIRLDIEASSIEQAMAYIELLEKTSELDQVHLVSQQPADQKNQALAGSLKPVLQFSLLARWASI